MATKARKYRIKCCCFCGMTEYQVAMMVQGPAIGFESPIFICDACVRVCSKIVDEDEKLRAGTVPPQEHAIASSASAAQASPSHSDLGDAKERKA